MTVPKHDLALQMAELARSIALRSVDDVLADVTAAAKQLIDGVDVAGVLLIGAGGSFETRAPTSDLMFKIDELQMRSSERRVQAALAEIVVRTDDFRQETGWALVAADGGGNRGAQRACPSSCTPPSAPQEPSICSRSSPAVGLRRRDRRHHPGRPCGGSHHRRRQGDQLKAALPTHRIGQAKGIIMERFRVDDVRAFEMMRQLSQDSNSKLTDIAQRVIDTRAE